MKIFLSAMMLPMMLLFSCNNEKEYVSTLVAQDLELSLLENPEANQLLGAIQASVDKGELEFELLSETESGAFQVDAASGEVRVGNPDLFDFEMSSILSAQVSVSDGRDEVVVSVTVELEDFDEVPAVIDVGNWSHLAMENVWYDMVYTANHLFGSLNASVDKGNLTYEVLSETVPGALSLDTETGDIRLLNPDALDFEVNESIGMEVLVSGYLTSQQVSVSVDIIDRGFISLNGNKVNLEEANLQLAGSMISQYPNGELVLNKEYVVTDGVYDMIGSTYEISSYSQATYFISFSVSQMGEVADLSQGPYTLKSGLWDDTWPSHFMSIRYGDVDGNEYFTNSNTPGHAIFFGEVNGQLLMSINDAFLHYRLTVQGVTVDVGLVPFAMDYAGELDQMP